MADSEKTATQSHEPSVYHEKGVVDATMPSTATAVTAAESIVADEKATAEEKTSNRNSTASAANDDDDFEYPTKGALAAITVALCLSVFCMALVRS